MTLAVSANRVDAKALGPREVEQAEAMPNLEMKSVAERIGGARIASRTRAEVPNP